MRIFPAPLAVRLICGESPSPCRPPHGVLDCIRTGREMLVRIAQGKDFGYDLQAWHDYLKESRQGGYTYGRNILLPKVMQRALASEAWREAVRIVSADSVDSASPTAKSLRRQRERKERSMLVVHPNQCLIFFRDPGAEFTFARMQETLAAEGATGVEEGEGEGLRLAVRWGDGPTLRLAIRRGPSVAGFAQGLMGRGRKYRALAAECDAYIEIRFEDLEEVLDEINTLIVVQGALQPAVRGLLYRSWNRTFTGPDEENPA